MNKFFALFLIGLCLFGAFIPVVYAEDGEDDEWDDENDREVSFQVDGSSVEFESEDDVLGNELEFHAEASGDGLYVEVEYQTSSQVNSTESEVKFKSLVFYVYEYQETNNQSGYQEGADTLVQSWKLGDEIWSDFNCSSFGTAPTVYTCSISASIIAAIIYISDGVADVNGVPLKPSGVKIDLNIVKASANPIAVALGFKSETETEYEVEDESDEEEEGFTSESEKQLSFGSDAFFSWIETATINNQTINITNSDLNSDLIDGSSLNEASGDYNYIIFSFDTTEIGTIIWDPKAAVGSTVGGSSSGAGNVVPSLVLLLIALFGLMY